MAIQRVLKGSSETKYVSDHVMTPNYVVATSGNVLSQLRAVPGSTTNTAFTCGIASVAEIYSALPRVFQPTAGTNYPVDNYLRVGDMIQPTKCRLDFTIAVSDNTTANSYDYNVHIFVLTAKAVKSIDDFGSIPITELLQDGQGSTAQFDGSLHNEQLSINSRQFSVLHHKKIRLAKSINLVNGSSPSGGGAVSGVSSHNGFKRVSMSIKVPKQLKYDTASARYPTNYAPFVVIGWTRNDSFGNGTTGYPSTSDVLVMARSHLWFKDI